MADKTLIQNSALYNIVQSLPGVGSGATVTITIRRLSDGYYWNFTSLAFQLAATTGSMTYDSDSWWKASFTPSANNTFMVTIYEATLDVHFDLAYQSVGDPTSVSTVTAGTNDLTTLAALKSHMGITVTTYDTLLSTLITACSAVMQTYLNRKLNSQTYTNEYYDGTGNNNLLLKNYPIISVSAVEYYDQVSNEVSETFIVNTDYILRLEEGMIDFWFKTREGVRNYRVTYVAGYTSVPADVALACNLFCSLVYNNIGKEDMRSESMGDYSYTKKDISIDTIPLPVKALISKYKRAML